MYPFARGDAAQDAAQPPSPATMSPDDPTPPTPPARPPGGVKRDRLPTRQDEAPAPGPPLSQHRRYWRSGLVLGVAIVAIVIFIAANSGGGTKPTPVVPSNHGPTETETEKLQKEKEQKEQEAKTQKPPPPTPPKIIWQNEITLEQNASYNIDQLPITKEKPSGYEVTSGGSLESVGAAKTAAWSGHAPPYFADCQKALATSGGEGVKLERPGQWMCGETKESSGRTVARLRFDGANGYSYRFYATVYKPGRN